MKEEFEIRAMGFEELARHYNPKQSTRGATNILRTWIAKHPGLHQTLKELGHSRKQKVLTPRQVSAIIEALGEP